MSANEYDESVVNLRFRHYQQRLMDRINKVIQERKSIKNKSIAKDGKHKITAQSHSALPNIKHKRRETSENYATKDQPDFHKERPLTAAYSTKENVTIGNSISATDLRDRYMNQALNRV